MMLATMASQACHEGLCIVIRMQHSKHPLLKFARNAELNFPTQDHVCKSCLDHGLKVVNALTPACIATVCLQRTLENAVWS
jgi:hypothetical protein